MQEEYFEGYPRLIAVKCGEKQGELLGGHFCFTERGREADFAVRCFCNECPEGGGVMRVGEFEKHGGHSKKFLNNIKIDEGVYIGMSMKWWVDRESSDIGDDLVNSRAEVWWPGMQQWYPGTVTEFVADKALHIIRYDDGQVEHLKWPLERTRVLPEDAPQQQGGVPDEPTPAPAAQAPVLPAEQPEPLAAPPAAPAPVPPAEQPQLQPGAAGHSLGTQGAAALLAGLHGPGHMAQPPAAPLPLPLKPDPEGSVVSPGERAPVAAAAGGERAPAAAAAGGARAARGELPALGLLPAEQREGVSAALRRIQRLQREKERLTASLSGLPAAAAADGELAAGEAELGAELAEVAATADHGAALVAQEREEAERLGRLVQELRRHFAQLAASGALTHVQALRRLLAGGAAP